MFTGQIAEISNREDFEILYEALDDDTNEAINLASAAIDFEIRDQGCRRIVASIENGKITLVEPSVFRTFIGKEEIKCLCAGTYEVGVTIENAGITRSLIVGSISVVDGVVR
jgi:hypothetical protein